MGCSAIRASFGASHLLRFNKGREEGADGTAAWHEALEGKERWDGGEGEAKELELLQSRVTGCMPVEKPALVVLLCLVPFLHRKGRCIVGGKDCRSKTRKIIHPELNQSLSF